MQKIKFGVDTEKNIHFLEKTWKLFHTVDTVHLRHIKLGYRPTDAH
jgi:hypothetical protein